MKEQGSLTLNTPLKMLKQHFNSSSLLDLDSTIDHHAILPHTTYIHPKWDQDEDKRKNKKIEMIVYNVYLRILVKYEENDEDLATGSLLSLKLWILHKEEREKRVKVRNESVYGGCNMRGEMGEIWVKWRESKEIRGKRNIIEYLCVFITR